MPRTKHLHEIMNAAITAAGPEHALRSRINVQGETLTIAGRDYDLRNFDRIRLLGAGKASAAMAKVAEDILGDLIHDGVVVTKYGHGVDLVHTRVMEASHPVPDAAGQKASAALLAKARECGERDLVLALISGGASALTPAPRPPVTLDEKQHATRLMLECGATIHEINAVRKPPSLFKGGLLAEALAPATVVSLIISDVVGDDLDAIASGPTAPDASTCTDCLAILDRYDLRYRMPASVREMLESQKFETLKPGADCFAGVHNVICAGNKQGLQAAADKARSLGYSPLVLTSRLEGEAKEVAKTLAAIARDVALEGLPVKAPACLLAGGEPTVTIRGKGKGGRNQELALAAALALEGREESGRITAGSVGTDGTDGPTDAAGAILLPGILKAARDRGHDPHLHLTNNHAYPILDEIGALVRTGPTGTNVMDVVGFLVE